MVSALAQSIRESHDTYGTPLALDLFCGVGGTAAGLMSYGHRGPGWEVLGIDIDGSKEKWYPGFFLKHDLREGLPEVVDEVADLIDIVWASPPCTFATGLQFRRSGDNLIPLARSLIEEVEAPVKIIENVPGAREELQNPVRLCGGALGLNVRKHRLFETNFFSMGTPCDHPDGGFEFVIGEKEAPVQKYREAHGIWRAQLPPKAVREAIPPSYVHYLISQYQRYRT